MCGIVGFIDKQNTTNNKKHKEIIQKMLGLLSHRGGDTTGIISYKNATIGHTRLSIVDTTHNADQPFTDGESILSYNGEIYNHKELRDHYCLGKEILSTSDTATLFEILKILPIEDVLEKINGMYAFSFLDRKSQKLSLVLDKMAIKPLYYVDTSEYFAWSSEIKAFRALPNFTFTMNSDLLFEHLLFRYILGAQTLFKNIYKLQSGEYLSYLLDSNTYYKKKYFELKKGDTGSLDIENILNESVRSHLMSDVPVGVQLSGGIDSNMVSYIAQKNSLGSVHSFSIGLKDNIWNEFEYSDVVASQIRTIHHKILFTKEDFINNLEKITYHLDEPIVHPNTIPMYLLAKFARQYTKVLLTGEGADEVFLGYKRYLKKSITSDDDLLFSNSFSTVDTVSGIIKNARCSLSEREKFIKEVVGLDYQDKLSFYDMFTYLPHVLLRQDKAGMAANIENRVPFLYESVVQAGYNLDLKIGKLGGKTPIKKIAMKYFSRDFVMREKCGFGLPISEWLKDESGLLPHLQALKNSRFISEYFKEKAIDKLICEHLNAIDDHSAVLFSLIGLDVWYNIFCKAPVFSQEKKFF